MMKRLIAVLTLTIILGFSAISHAYPTSEQIAQSTINTARSQVMKLENKYGSDWVNTAPKKEFQHAYKCVDLAISAASGRAKGTLWHRPHFQKELNKLKNYKEEMERRTP
ncbi:hypothetical protein [Pseudodesulfovibrio sp. zrk46]|uniref:hypothetical protein n=1 Tax=Pseudodesulfovibrio sp. zrk46 TaxID=2725288 RepID=UPI001448EFDD|nr:hypothetical protein [Pseudodesulfovibrio sp. zrk46]QJB55308.1 hypothetical protein HFN16_02350 [Pseudodesulfovibrio sp. zrk46]